MSGFNIANFVSNGLIGGGFRPSLFSVRLAAPPPGVVDASNDLEYVVRSASVPASIIEKVNAPYFGRQVPLAGDRVFQDWQVTVMCDEDFRHRNMFESWHNKINALKSNRQNSDSDDLLDYMVDAEVLLYGKAGPGDDSGVVRAYTFRNMWPSVVDGIRVDWEDGNRIAMFDVTFAYTLWEPTIFHPSITPFNGTLAPDPTDTVPVVSALA